MARRKIALLVASILVGLLGVPVNQASAAHKITIEFQCKLTLNPGETMRNTPAPPATLPDRHGSINCGKDDKEENKDLFDGNPHPEAYWCRATIGTGVVKKTKPAALPGGASRSNCSINTSKGTIRIGPSILGVGPYCDQSSGGIDKARGVKIRVNLANGNFKYYKLFFEYTQLIGTNWKVVGEIQKLLGGPKGPKVQTGPLADVAFIFKHALEKNRSCFAAAGADKFTISGVVTATLTDVNGGKPPGTP